MSNIKKTIKINSSKSLATICAKLSSEKIASDILVLDLKEHSTSPADYFVICSTDSSNQSKAILDLILRQVKSAGVSKPRVEGEQNGEWILIDFFDVVVHIMLTPIREYYSIEKIWENAIIYQLNETTGRLNKK